MEIINLTPHDVSVLQFKELSENVGAEYGLKTFKMSGKVARCETTSEPMFELESNELERIKVYRTVFSHTVDLPEYEEDKFYIVSRNTVDAARNEGRRVDDLLVPMQMIKDHYGNIIGCRGFGTYI